MSMPRDAIRLGLGVREGPQTEFEAAAQSYQDEYGWTVGVYRTGVWLVSGREIDALDMPRKLGERARTALGDSVPLFESPDDHGVRWVFLVVSHAALLFRRWPNRASIMSGPGGASICRPAGSDCTGCGGSPNQVVCKFLTSRPWHARSSRRGDRAPGRE